MMPTLFHARWMLAGFAVACGLAAGLTMAAIPAPDGTIRACYHKKSGRLRVVDEGASCKGKEIVLSWAQPGTPGPQGLTGADGAPGEPATRLWAVVDSAGTLLRGSGVAVPVGTDLSASGNTRAVPFDRDLSECAWVAAIGGDHVNAGVVKGFITSTLGPNAQTVRVSMTDSDNASVQNQGFHVIVFC